MFQRLYKWILKITRSRRAGLRTNQTHLGLKVKIATNNINAGQIATIIDYEHTEHPMIQFDHKSPYRISCTDLEFIDASTVTTRPQRYVVTEQLLEFAGFALNKLIEQPKFFLVSELTLRHIMNESVTPDITYYTSPRLLDLGGCPVTAEVVVRGIPVIDKLPDYLVNWRTGFEVPHFVVGIGSETGVYYMAGILNPEICNLPMKDNKEGKRKSLPIKNNVFNNPSIKKKARWNI